jgi:cytochrome c oxidase subunit 2
VRYWSVLFLLTALVCMGVFVYAPFDPQWWMPRNHSTLGREVDHLFVIILWITGLVFMGTQVALAYAMWTGASDPNRKAQFPRQPR